VRATITQRQKDGGAFIQRKEYYVDCAIEFIDQERQRIYANRDTLLTHVIASGPDMSYGEYRWSPRSYSRGAPFVLVLLLVVGIPTLPRPIADHLGSVLLLLLLIGYCIFNFYNDHEGFAASDKIRVATVLDQPRFSIYARSADDAQTIATDIRTRLNDLDALLKERSVAV
jgi:hypothetical protein